MSYIEQQPRPETTGLVLQPLPVGAWAFVGLTVTVATKTLPFMTAFSAFRNEVIWLIVVSFYFAKGFEKCGLGDRIANLFVKTMGSSTLGLAYGLTIAEGIIAPAMPSTSARAGGIFMPIIKSLSEAAGSFPGETSKKLGSYLVFTIMHVRVSPLVPLPALQLSAHVLPGAHVAALLFICTGSAVMLLGLELPLVRGPSVPAHRSAEASPLGFGAIIDCF